ncbi:MAG: translation initiation factor IF-2 [Lachnospiraceae bacterium]|nr:translation initiation factor IF-2 [Lachnospiraceae bacterium]
MAKIVIKDLATELGMSNKEVLAIAAEKGIEAKAYNSSVEPADADRIRAAAGKGGAKAPAPAKESPAPEKKAVPKAEEKAAKPAEQAPKAEAPKAPAAEAPKAAPQGKPAQPQKGDAPAGKGGRPQGENAPRKKNISMVFNPQYSRMNGGQGGRDNRGGQGGGYQRNNNNGGGYNGSRQGSGQPTYARTPIKPLTPPSATPSVNMVPEHHNQPKKPAPEVKATPSVTEPVNTAPAAAPHHQERPTQAPRQNAGGSADVNRGGARDTGRDQRQFQGRPQGQQQSGGRSAGGYGNRNGQGQQGANGQRPYRQGQESFQGGQRGSYGNAAPGRGYNNSGRGQRPGGGQGGSFGGGRPQPGKGFGGAPAAGDKGRNDRRGKGKDNKKDVAYSEEIESKQNRPGRFIKPVKKVEEAPEEVIKVITLPDTITIKDLADKMKQRPADIIKKLFLAGKIVTLNQEISYEDAENIAMEYEILCEHEVKVNVIEELLKEEDEAESEMVSRPPVVCVMGHVDHGKTSLLDAIRNTNVTDREAGGITQAIGAYTVNIKGRSITFLDTPGHEAFTAMRMRGANATDIAILVVAADDGVMPQTVEAINHAKAAGVEIIVAVNKIDKPSANVDRVKQELSEYQLIPEDWGGSTVFANVSAKTGEGIDSLLEMILLTSDVLELKANPNRRARGLVIEAELDKGRGPVATVLVQKGTLKVGDFISAGASHGKVRAMIDDKGRRVKEALPSVPVEILGLSDVPEAGEVFIAHENDKTARSFAETYMAENKQKKIEETQGRMSLEDLFTKIQEGNLKELNVIVKADVQGSVEAVKESLTKLSNEEVVVRCIHGGVGAINESDVNLASASDAIIIGFNVRPDATAKDKAEQENVDVRLYNVIYQAIEDIEKAMKGMLDPVFEEKVIGHAEVRQIFKASAIGNIAGSYVLDGEIRRGCKVRITRQGAEEPVWEGELASLKRFKDDVKEVKAGFECGLVFEGFDKMQEADVVEAYIMVEVPR